MGEISRVTDKILIANQGQSWVSSSHFDLLAHPEKFEHSLFHTAKVNVYSWSFVTNFLEFSFLIVEAISKHTTVH